jgi:hypothetical protein
MPTPPHPPGTAGLGPELKSEPVAEFLMKDTATGVGSVKNPPNPMT